MTMIDALEPRRLFAASLLRVSSVTADNRGEILVQFSERATGVKGSAFQVYTAGPDGKLFNGDDVRQSVGFTYSKGKKLLRIVANIPKDAPYRLKLDGKTRIHSEETGALLDGDFVSASRASGDGVAGGNYEMQVQRDTSDTPQVKMRTSLGDITVRVFKADAPVSAGAFLTLANQGKYDNLLITRLANDFVVQLGAVQVTGDGSEPTDLVGNTSSEFGQEARVLSNLRGRLSFARGSTADGRTDIASNQFFFNIEDNDGSRSGGNNLDIDTDAANDSVFSPFAEITSAAGYATLDAINAKTAYDLTNVIGPFSGTGVDAVPAVGPPDSSDPTFRPARDGLIVQRTAVLSNVVSKLG